MLQTIENININKYAEQLGFIPLDEDIPADIFDNKKSIFKPIKTKRIRKVKLYSKEERKLLDEIEALEEVYYTYGEDTEKFNEIKRKIPKNKLAQVMYEKEEKITVLRDIKQAIWHVQKTHITDDLEKTMAFNIISKDASEKYQYNFTFKELTSHKLNKIIGLSEEGFNVYVSQNTFISKYRRKKEYVWNSSALMVDLDYYKIDELKDLTASQVVKKMRNDKTINFIEPSYTVDSGNGLYLVYLLKSVPMFKFDKVKSIWETTVRALVERYKDYGADMQATDISRVNRIPCSVNQKTGRTVQIVNFDEIKNQNLLRHNLYDLYQTTKPKPKKVINLPQKQTKNNKEKRSPQRTKKLNTGKIEAVKREIAYEVRNLSSVRIKDIRTLIKLRNGDMENYRNFTAFLYSLFSFDIFNDNYEKVLENTYNLNCSFLSPLSNAEIEKTVKSAYKSFTNKINDKQHYNYKNETIVKKLEITEEEQKHMKTLISKEVKFSRKYEKRKQKRRNDSGLTLREAKKQQNISIIKELQKEGYKQKEIAERVNLSERMVRVYLKEIRDS